MIEQNVTARLNDPDLALVRGMAAGNGSDLDELYARYGPPIFSYLMARLEEHALAEEVLQDVMYAAWTGAAQFRGESKVLTWLLTIAHNRAINARRRRTPPIVPLHDDIRDTDTGPFEQVMRGSERLVVRETLNRLPAHHREVLVLVFYHQLTESEVAEVLGIAVGTVKSRLHRAKEELRRVLHSEGRF